MALCTAASMRHACLCMAIHSHLLHSSHPGLLCTLFMHKQLIFPVQLEGCSRTHRHVHSPHTFFLLTLSTASLTDEVG